jgi:hypothetical protein
VKEKIKRSLAFAVAPLALVLMVTTASAASAATATATATSATSVSQAKMQSASTPAKVAGYPSIWSLECNVITVGKFGINPITGQLYQCEYDEDLGGYLWLPVYICPNTSNYVADHPDHTC